MPPPFIFKGPFTKPPKGPQPAQPLTDLAAYPILTEEVGFPPSPLARSGSVPTGQAPGGGTGQLAQTAMNAVANVLGWKLRTDDPKGFVGALTASFSLTEIEGHVESKWIPRTYAVQTDLSGGITGAQASLWTRAKYALDQSLPLLDGLYALNPAAEPEDLVALRGVVRSQLTELVNELPYVGGPRVARVNQYFFLLLGQTITTGAIIQTDPDQVAGTLGNLRNVFGLSTTNAPGVPNPLVNTIEDEKNTTNYRVLSDYLTSLAQSWVSNLPFFGLTTNTPFLGTQLVLISRQLSVTSELVDELRFALDSVFIGPSERQTLQLNFNNPALTPIFLEDLLIWIDKFASGEAPDLIQSGGKFGVAQVLSIVNQLQGLVQGATSLNNTPPTIPAGYFTPRVTLAVQTLANQLSQLAFIAGQVATTGPLPVNPI